MKTLQYLADHADQHPQTFGRRMGKKIDEIAEYISPFLRDGLDARRIAESAFDLAFENGNIIGNDVHGEVRSDLTKSGNPLTFTI